MSNLECIKSEELEYGRGKTIDS